MRGKRQKRSHQAHMKQLCGLHRNPEDGGKWESERETEREITETEKKGRGAGMKRQEEMRREEKKAKEIRRNEERHI